MGMFMDKLPALLLGNVGGLSFLLGLGIVLYLFYYYICLTFKSYIMYCVVYSDNFKPYYFRAFKCVGSLASGVSNTMQGYTVMPGRFESKSEAQDYADYLDSIGYANEMDELFI